MRLASPCNNEHQILNPRYFFGAPDTRQVVGEGEITIFAPSTGIREVHKT